MSIDKTERITLIITNIIIWSLISIVLFFFGMIYVNAYVLNNQCGNYENLLCGTTGPGTINTTIDYGTKKPGNYHLKLRTHIDMEISRNEYEKQNVVSNINELIQQVLDFRNIEINLGQYWYNQNTQYWSNVNASYNWKYIRTKPPEIPEQYQHYILRVFINFEADINVPTGYTNNATRFSTYIRRSDRYYEGADIDNFTFDYIGDNTEQLLQQGNENTSWIGNIVDSMHSKMQEINEWITNQYYLQMDLNNNMVQGQQDIFNLVESAIFGDYTIKDMNGQTQFISMVSGENRLDLKLGQSNVDFDFSTGARELGTGMDFIWTQINAIRVINPQITAIIGMGLLLMLCKQALGRKNN